MYVIVMAAGMVNLCMVAVVILVILLRRLGRRWEGNPYEYGDGCGHIL